MDRMGLLQQFIDNWPGRMDLQRCMFIEKKTRWATHDEIELAVEICLDERQQPPAVADFRQCIMKARARLRMKARKPTGRTKEFLPGDVIDGTPTFTPAGAAEEAARIRREYPDAFAWPHKKDFGTPEGRRATLENSLNRMLVAALDRLAKRDPSLTIKISDFKQPEMF